MKNVVTKVIANIRRDLNPHKPARVAMILWNREYASGGKGSMSFWDSLTESEKQTCREIVEQIAKAPDEIRERQQP